MNDDVGKGTGWMNNLKAFIREQLWLIMLLAPLIVIPFLVTEHFDSSKKPRSHVKTAVSVVSAISPEVTSVQLAAIVAKPLGDLLKMEVYFDRKSNTRSTSSLISSAEGNNTTDAFNQPLVTFKANQYLHMSKKNSLETDG